MKMFYVSLCFFFFAIVHVQSCNYGKIRSADDIDYDFIREIVDMEEVENWAAIIKQNIIYTDKYESALPFISKEDQSTKIINVFDLLQTYVKNEEMRKTMNINVIRDIIKDCYECTSLKILSLFAFLASKDLKSIKKYHETINSDKDKDISENRDEKVDEKQDVSKDESTTHTCINENYQGAGCTNPSKFDPCNSKTDELLFSPSYLNRYHEINDSLEIRATGSEEFCSKVLVRGSVLQNILQMEKTFTTMISKQATLNITYDIPLEVFKVIYGQRAADVTIDNYINGMLCVLEETLKIVDDLLKEKCVDHQGSLVKKYETLLEDDSEKEFKQYITALDHDSNTKYDPRFFTDFVLVSGKAIEETNSIALSKDLRLPKDLALLDKCFISKITFDQQDLELLLNNPLSVPSSEDLERRILTSYEHVSDSEYGHLLNDLGAEVDNSVGDMLNLISYEEYNKDHEENDDSIFDKEGRIKYINLSDHDEILNTFSNDNYQIEDYLGNITVDRSNDVGVLESDHNEIIDTFLNVNSQLSDFSRKDIEDGNNDVEVFKSDDNYDYDETVNTFLNKDTSIWDFLSEDIGGGYNDDSSDPAHNAVK